MPADSINLNAEIAGERTEQVHDRYAPLQAEIAKPAYSGKSDKDVADAINVLVVDARRPIPGPDVLRFMTQRGIIGAASIFARDQSKDEQLRAICESVCLAFQFNTFAFFDMDDPAAKAEADRFTGGLVEAGCMAPDQVTDLYAMAATKTPWTVAIMGLPYVSDLDIAAARKFAPAKGE